MRLLYQSDRGLSLTDDLLSSELPPYAILSHTWGRDEVTFRDILEGTASHKPSFNKIRFCGEQAYRDELVYFWVDTCCIDRSNSSELQEAINSMFRWYRGAKKCYVYLADYARLNYEVISCAMFVQSRWFTRGWTLQELVAPTCVEFYSRDGVYLGNKQSAKMYIHDQTGIPLEAFLGTRPLSEFGVDERFGWIAGRATTREEDMAYSLLGIFGVHIPLIYGEGERNAFRRLREEIAKVADHMRGAPVATDTLGQPRLRWLRDWRDPLVATTAAYPSGTVSDAMLYDGPA